MIVIKGWRNDPRWVEHYKRRDDERAQRALMLLKMKHEIARNLRESEFFSTWRGIKAA